MSLIAKSEGNLNIKKLEDGVYTAVSSMLVDLGIQKSEKYGKSSRKIIIVWNVTNEFIEINGEKLPRVMSKEYTMTLSEKSTLRKDLQAWRGKQFTQEELKGFNLANILNKGCQLQILNTENNGKTYTNIVAIMALPKGMSVESLDKTIVFDTYDENTWNNYKVLPIWIQDKIKKAENISEKGLDIYIKEYEEIVKENQGKQEENTTNNEITTPDDDLPF